jgi:hypothetical protein
MDMDVESSLLYQAVLQGKVDDVCSGLIDKVFNWDFGNNDEDDYIFRCALEKAIELNHQNIVVTMLQSHFGDKYGAGNWRSQYVDEALETAARLGKQEILRQLLETERDNIRKISNALTYGVQSQNLQILTMLIDAGASLNHETQGTTPLMQAVSTGDLIVVQFLVEAGADPNKWIDDGGYVSPLIVAAREGHEDIFNYLMPLVLDDEEVEFSQKELSRNVTRRERRKNLP